MATESELIAQVTARAIISMARAEAIEVPERIAQALAQMCAETNQRVVKVSAGMTAELIVPDGPLPEGVSRFDWQAWRMFGMRPRRRPNTPISTMPGARVIHPAPCYVVHVSDNGITCEAWLSEHGFQASSDRPFQCTLREVS